MIRTGKSFALIVGSTLAFALTWAVETRAQITATAPATVESRNGPLDAATVVLPEHYAGFRSGILECTPNAETCDVANMPLLLQTDPRIDKDVQIAAGGGCYDTSIVTVILAALNNRDPNLQPGGRTQKFMEIPAGFKDGQPVPKEIKQLSQQYRWLLGNQLFYSVHVTFPRPQPFFITEVVGDFGPIHEQCDPFIYRSCAADSNKDADAFSSPLPLSSGEVNNLQVINLLKAGYAPLIAYQRWRPIITKNSDGTKSLKFAYLKPHNTILRHKVVFSGFHSGTKYPLLVNNVGSGIQQRARLTTDLAGRLADKFKPIIYPMTSHTFIECEGHSSPTEQVDFVEGLDAIRITPANKTPFPPTQEESAIATDLLHKGCKQWPGRIDGDYLCTTYAGLSACNTYLNKDQVAVCRKAR